MSDGVVAGAWVGGSGDTVVSGRAEAAGTHAATIPATATIAISRLIGRADRAHRIRSGGALEQRQGPLVPDRAEGGSRGLADLRFPIFEQPYGITERDRVPEPVEAVRREHANEPLAVPRRPPEDRHGLADPKLREGEERLPADEHARLVRDLEQRAHAGGPRLAELLTELDQRARGPGPFVRRFVRVGEDPDDARDVARPREALDARAEERLDVHRICGPGTSPTRGTASRDRPRERARSTRSPRVGQRPRRSHSTITMNTSPVTTPDASVSVESESRSNTNSAAPRMPPKRVPRPPSTAMSTTWPEVPQCSRSSDAKPCPRAKSEPASPASAADRTNASSL